MATWTATGHTSLLTVIAHTAGPWWRRSRQAVGNGLRLLFRLLLTVAGLALITAAAWLIAVPLGLVVAGVGCLVLEWAVKRE